MDEDNDAIQQRLAAMERDVLRREAAAEQKRRDLLKEVEREEIQVRRYSFTYTHVLTRELRCNFDRVFIGPGSNGAKAVRAGAQRVAW